MRSRFTEEPATQEDFAATLFGISESEIWSNPVFHQNYSLESVKLEEGFLNYYSLLFQNTNIGSNDFEAD